PLSGMFTFPDTVHVVFGRGTAIRLAVPTAVDGTTWSIDGRRAWERNHRRPSPNPAIAMTGSQLNELSLCTAWATTGEAADAAAVAVAGQNRSLRPAGRALLMVALSRCRALARPSIVIPPSRTRLPIKLTTNGAAMESKVAMAPDGSPDSRLMPLVTVFSELPNIAVSRRLPVAIKDELGSATLLAIWDQDMAPVLGTISSIFCNAPESSDLLAMPPSIVATDDSIARATD